MARSLLIDKYPLVLRAAGKPSRYPRLPIAYGEGDFACGAGWHPIIDELLAWLEAEAQAIKAAGKRPPIIAQIKEKFGTLAIHVTGFPRSRFFADLAPRLDAARARSKIVCEICGAAGRLRQDGWWRTRCDCCEAERA